MPMASGSSMRFPTTCASSSGRTRPPGRPTTLRTRQRTPFFFQRHICRLEPLPDCLIRARKRPATGAVDTEGWDVLARLGEIRVPTLVTCGRHDFCTAAHAALISAAIRGTMIQYFTERALTVRAAQLRLAQMPYREKERLAAEFKTEIAGMPAEEQAQVRRLLRSGLMPVPSDLNQLLIAAVDGG